jgi:hypothetical protein
MEVESVVVYFKVLSGVHLQVLYKNTKSWRQYTIVKKYMKSYLFISELLLKRFLRLNANNRPRLGMMWHKDRP